MSVFDIPASEEILNVFVWFGVVYLDDTKANETTHFLVINDDVVVTMQRQ